MTLRLSGLLLKDPRSRGESSRNQRADGIRAMPSARALLVASLLTEPPYGCLGPSGCVAEIRKEKGVHME